MPVGMTGYFFVSSFGESRNNLYLCRTKQKNNNEDDVDVIIHATAPTGNGLYRVAHLVSATRQVVF
jgi:hypothetical protein